MNWGIIGIGVVFLAFIVLLIVHPNLSCFGRKLKSPFYPLFRRKSSQEKTSARSQEALKGTKTKKVEDYGFRLD